MPVKFYEQWYEKLVRSSDEKKLVADKLVELCKDISHEGLLEVGMGTAPYFAERLHQLFSDYWIVEKQPRICDFPRNVQFFQEDYEVCRIERTFDVILLSHVVYYFNDLKEVIQKTLNLLKKGGRAYFVVNNGCGGDYVKTKAMFSHLTGVPLTFTYELLKQALEGTPIKEYSVNTKISFTSHEDLYESMALFFDLYPEEFRANREPIIHWLQGNITNKEFTMVQQIIEISKE